MPRTFSESDFMPRRRVFYKSEFADTSPSPNPIIPENPNFEVETKSAPLVAQASLSPVPVNLGDIVNPTTGERFRQGFMNPHLARPLGYSIGDLAERAGRDVLPVGLGAVVGGVSGAAAAPAGPLAQAYAAIRGAGAGGAAGRALQRTAMALTDSGQQAPIYDVLSDVLASGASQALAEAGGQGVAALAPATVRLGAQMLRAGPGIPERYGEAALRDLGLLSRAKPQQAISDEYNLFEYTTGLNGLNEKFLESGEQLTDGNVSKILNSAYQKVTKGRKVDTQELYEASQAGRWLKDQAKMGNPQQAGNLRNTIIKKSAVDDALETQLPGYKQLRQEAFESKVGQQFESLVPLNRNQSPNVLRTYTAGAAAAVGAANEQYGALGLPFLISPASAKLGIKSLYYGGKVGIPLADMATRFGTQSFEDAYLSRSPVP